MADMTPERAEFDKWAMPRFRSLLYEDGEEHCDLATSYAWLGWQAGVAAERERAAKVCDRVGTFKPDTDSATARIIATTLNSGAAMCAAAIRESEK